MSRHTLVSMAPARLSPSRGHGDQLLPAPRRKGVHEALPVEVVTADAARADLYRRPEEGDTWVESLGQPRGVAEPRRAAITEPTGILGCAERSAPRLPSHAVRPSRSRSATRSRRRCSCPAQPPQGVEEGEVGCRRSRRHPTSPPRLPGAVGADTTDACYTWLNGTWMAAPHATGVVALIRSAPSESARRLRDRGPARLRGPSAVRANSSPGVAFFGAPVQVCSGGVGSNNFYGKGLGERPSAGRSSSWSPVAGSAIAEPGPWTPACAETFPRHAETNRIGWRSPGHGGATPSMSGAGGRCDIPI